MGTGMRIGAAIVLGVGLVGAALASERAERLVARGELAYQAGHWEEARSLFAEAALADPADAVARYHVGLALGKLERWDEAIDAFERGRRLRPGFDEAERALAFARQRAEEAAAREVGAKRWELRATAGVQYDSNVQLAPGGQLGHLVGDRDDAAFILGGGGQYDLIRRPEALVRLQYDLYQTLHPDIDDFDFLSQQVLGTASYRLHRALWAGVQGGYNHYTLGSHGYLSEPFVLPFLSLLEGEQGRTEVSYRHGEATYLSRPFHEVRDGPNDTVAASQTLTFGPRSVTAGYEYAEERPISARGDDYRLESHRGYVSVGFPAWWSIDVDLAYRLRYDGYTEPNSAADFRTTRHDLAHEFHAGLSRPIAAHLRAAILYYGTLNGSNLGLFDYRRHIVSGVLQVTY